MTGEVVLLARDLTRYYPVPRGRVPASTRS